MTTAEQLRQATEDDVAAALKDAYIAFPGVARADLLEFFNLMLDHILGDSVGD